MNNGVYALPGFMAPAAKNWKSQLLTNEDGSVKLCVYVGKPGTKVYYSLGIPGWNWGFIKDAQYFIDKGYPEAVIKEVSKFADYLEEEVTELPEGTVIPDIIINGWPLPITESPIEGKVYWILNIPKFILPAGDTEVQISANGKLFKYTITRPAFSIHNNGPGYIIPAGTGGNTLLSDMIAEHANDTSLHITSEERSTWNSLESRVLPLETNTLEAEAIEHAPNATVIENAGGFSLEGCEGEICEIHVYGAEGNSTESELALFDANERRWSENTVVDTEGEMVFRFNPPLQPLSVRFVCIQPPGSQGGYVTSLASLRLYSTDAGHTHTILSNTYPYEAGGRLAMKVISTKPIYATTEDVGEVESTLKNLTENHTKNATIHVTAADKALWNSAASAPVDTEVTEDSTNTVTSGAVFDALHYRKVLQEYKGTISPAQPTWQWSVVNLEGCTRVELDYAYAVPPTRNVPMWLVSGTSVEPEQISINSAAVLSTSNYDGGTLTFDFAQPITGHQFWLVTRNELIDMFSAESMWTDARPAPYVNLTKNTSIPTSRYYGDFKHIRDHVVILEKDVVEHVNDTSVHITAAERTDWNERLASLEDSLGSGADLTGIPLSCGSGIEVASNECGEYSIALGEDNKDIGHYSISLGYSNYVHDEGLYSTSLGYSNYASGEYPSALGCFNEASEDLSTALGYMNKATAEGSTALGSNNNAERAYATAVGYSNQATIGNTTALGSNNNAAGAYATAVGYSNQAVVGTATALGAKNTASGSYTTTLGYNNTASGNDAIALGSSNRASGSYSTALGGNNTASVSCAIALGSSNVASGSYSTVLGQSSEAYGHGAIALGREATAVEEYSITVGSWSQSNGYNSVAVGPWSCADGYDAIGIGNGAYAYNNATALGLHAVAAANSSTALGVSARADKEGSLVISAANKDSGTSVSLELVAGTATGGEGDMFSDDKFVTDTDVKLTVRDTLTGREHSVSVSLSKLMQHLVQDLQGVSEFGTSNYGYYYY